MKMNAVVYGTYLLTNRAKAITWAEWLRLGGCGLSDISRCQASAKNGPQAIWEKKGITLGQLTSGYLPAERELARFAKEHLDRVEFYIAEQR